MVSLISTRAAQPGQSALRRNQWTILASVRLTVLLLILIASTVLIGAWCPQESQVGKEKIIEQFGEQTAFNLMSWGITDIFHTPWFLSLIGFLTVNMVACSVQRVFPKVKLLRHKMPWLTEKEIVKLPVSFEARISHPDNAISYLTARLRKLGYRVSFNGLKMTAEYGKFGRLAATVTHIGLLTLLLGVTISSWTGFSGFKPMIPHSVLDFDHSEHSKLWLGNLPKWRVRVDATRRETYDSGEPKQWYSDLSVIDNQGVVIKQQEISVNNPLSYGGVDIYQSSWGLDKLVVSFNGNERELKLSPMGKLYASFLPLSEDIVLILSVRDQDKPLRIFAKRPDWQAPRLLSEIKPGCSIKLGEVSFLYMKAVPLTGLQYKCDPGLPLTYTAFAFIISGVLMAMIPHRQVWGHIYQASDREGTFSLYLGGRSVKARVRFERSLRKLTDAMNVSFPKHDSGAPSEMPVGNLNIQV